MKCFCVIVLVALFYVISVSAGDSQPLNWAVNDEQEKSSQLEGHAGHNPKTETDVFVDGEKTVRRNGNNEHGIRAGRNFEQHYGGPYGRSPPSYEGRINNVRRFRRQIAPINPNKPFTLNGQVTHGQGVTGVNAAGSARLWESQNQRHQLHGMGSYGQVFTPYGNSRPNYGVGLGYVHRF